MATHKRGADRCRVSHAPSHVRVDAHRVRSEPAAPAALDGPPLARVHPRDLRAPDRRRPRTRTRPAQGAAGPGRDEGWTPGGWCRSSRDRRRSTAAAELSRAERQWPRSSGVPTKRHPACFRAQRERKRHQEGRPRVVWHERAASITRRSLLSDVAYQTRDAMEAHPGDRGARSGGRRRLRQGGRRRVAAPPHSAGSARRRARRPWR